LYLMLSTKKEPNCLPPDTISGLKMYPKCFFGRGYVPNPAGGAQALPHAPWPDLGRFTEGKGEREGRGKGWRGAQRRRSESRGTEERGRGRSGRNGRKRKGGAGVGFLEGSTRFASLSRSVVVSLNMFRIFQSGPFSNAHRTETRLDRTGSDRI